MRFANAILITPDCDRAKVIENLRENARSMGWATCRIYLLQGDETEKREMMCMASGKNMTGEELYCGPP